MAIASPRLRRLKTDHSRICERFRTWPRIRILEAIGAPPERYKIAYQLKGLEVSGDGHVRERQEHVIEVDLSLEYPRRMPQCKILTPIFHPNFDESTICTGDFWAASEGLDDLLIRIGRMIAYQEYNTKSPLNGLAARWASENAHLLPVDPSDVAPPSTTTVDSRNLECLRIDLPSAPTPVNPTAPANSGGQPKPAPRDERLEPRAATTCSTPAPDAEKAPTEEPSIRLGPDLELVSLKVRCDRCKKQSDAPLDALREAYRCPSCGHRHPTGRQYQCVALEGAGLVWFYES